MRTLRFHQTSPYGLRHRLKTLWRGFRGGGLQKSQRLYFVTLNGQRYKRLVFQDSATAGAIEDRLERLGFAAALPRVVTRYENELWLEFIKGRPATAGSPELVDALACFYGFLYRQAPRRQTLTQTRMELRLDRDLDFLQRSGLLNEAWRDHLRQAAAALRPAELWTGFDYVDPVLKNLVSDERGTGLCAVDVESLVDDVPLGTGVATALLHWLTPWEDRFWTRLAEQQVPDIRPAFPFVALCFTARWSKTKVLTGKGHLVSAARFERFLPR